MGYLESGQYPVFLIYDKSKGTYHRANAQGDVTIQQDVCRNGYPYCYAWENFNFYFVEMLNGNDNYHVNEKWNMKWDRWMMRAVPPDPPSPAY